MYTYVGVGIASNTAIPAITLYGISGIKELLIDKSLATIQGLETGMVINLRLEDEKIFVNFGIDTISLPVLLSIAGGCSYDMNEINSIFKKTIGINYTQVFLNDGDVDFTILFHSSKFWSRIAGLVCECLDILQRNGLMDFLLLEIQLVPILHRMFDEGYPIDAKRSMEIYKRLRMTLREMESQIKSRCEASVYRNKSKVKDKRLLELIQLRRKIEDKLRRIPYEIYNSNRSKAVISCNFRSIGTDTFRITTNHANIQGLPKDIRRCFLPRHGDMLIEYDMVGSQIIILACLSGEDSLIQSYIKGIDLYVHITSGV